MLIIGMLVRTIQKRNDREIDLFPRFCVVKMTFEGKNYGDINQTLYFRLGVAEINLYICRKRYYQQISPSLYVVTFLELLYKMKLQNV